MSGRNSAMASPPSATVPIRGRVFRFGDEVNTDDIIASEHLQRIDAGYLATKVMASIRPGFHAELQAAGGGVIVAGRNFGTGSSREQAPDCLRAAGVAAVVAESFRWIFFENACNVGLPVLAVPGISDAAAEGDVVMVDIERAQLINETAGRTLAGRPLPAVLVERLRDGGLLPMLRQYVIAHGMDRVSHGEPPSPVTKKPA